MTRTQRADLHMHGSIGFQPYWLKKQRYAGKNLLQLIADECFAKGITISAITCQGNTEGKGSVEDRLYCLRKHEAPLLPREYKVDSLGENVLVVEKGNSHVYIVSGQTVVPKEDGKDFDLLVVGANNVPDKLSFSDTLSYCSDNGLIQIAEHPFLETHQGMGKERLEKYIHRFDAIEGHNAQAIFRSLATHLPVVGSMLSRAGRELNEKAKASAKEYGKPYVANSDAHCIEDLGIAYNQWGGEMDAKSEYQFLKNLKDCIRSGQFIVHEGYEPIISWLKWVSTFQRGVKENKGISSQEKYIPSNKF
ncbi:MAG: PHP-associated domain-containing protein [Nanoarchaeota archaeon]